MDDSKPKENKGKTITMRVTEEEKNIIQLIRNFDWNNITNGFLYEKGDIVSRINTIDEKEFIKAIKKDEFLFTCYKAAINKHGTEEFFIRLSNYTPYLIRLGFQKEISTKYHLYPYFQKGEITKGYIKRYMECIHIVDKAKAIEDFKKYLGKMYKEEALEYIEKSNKLKENLYIPVPIKKNEIKEYIRMIEDCMEVSRDNLNDFDQDDRINLKIEMKFMEKLLEDFKRMEDDFTVKIHIIFLDFFIYIIESAMELLDGFDIFGNFDESFINMPEENISPSQRAIRENVVRNIYSKLEEIYNQYEETRNHYEYDIRFENKTTIKRNAIKACIKIEKKVRKEKRNGKNDSRLYFIKR